MQKSILLSFVAVFLVTSAFSQITINADDMPEVGDTIRQSITFNAVTYNFEETGNNYTWDFSNLQSLEQQVDSFVSVTSTPFVYQLVFIYPFVSTIAAPIQGLEIFPDSVISDAYTYYKETNDVFQTSGYAITVSGIPIPMKYDEPDVLYNFPLNPGQVDSSFSTFDLAIPNLGYFLTERKRVNTVDGWGTLTTPYGTFETIRIKSEVTQYDSLYVDSLSMGFPLERNYIEYKWLGNDFGLPLLTATEESLGGYAVEYIDSIQTATTSHEIALEEGFQFVSSHIIPDEPDMMDVLSSLLDENLVFVRNSNGKTLQKIGPNWINNIGNWETTEGYLFKMSSDDELILNGDNIDPLTPIPLQAGYQFVSYLPQSNIDAMDAFESIIGDDLDFIRNSNGEILQKIGDTWVNNIGMCTPGAGYLIRMNNDGELIYNVPVGR